MRPGRVAMLRATQVREITCGASNARPGPSSRSYPELLPAAGAPSTAANLTPVGCVFSMESYHPNLEGERMEQARIEAPDDHTPEGQSQPDLDLMVECWFGIAAVAWEGFMMHGPGTVMLTIVADRVQHSYWPGSPCVCHPLTADTYDPTEQAVVMISRNGKTENPIVVSGWPAPRVAYEAATIEVLGGTLQ